VKKSGNKRKKRKTGKRRGALKILMLLGTFFLLGAATSFFLNFHSGKPRKPRPAAYEEVHSRPPAHILYISKIDSALRSCFNQNKIPKERVQFVAVRPKQEKGVEWEFSELVVHVSKGAFKELDNDISKTLASLRPEVTYRSERVSEIEKTYHIFAKGFYTHKVRLAPLEHQSASGNNVREEKKDQARIAIIIDDIGHDVELAKSFTQLAFPVTLSILPLAPHTQTIVQMAKKAGCEYMLHLPMEPKEYPESDPGPGTLFVTMTDEKIREVLNADMGQVPGAIGVNNHMGSEFTENEGKMSALLRELKKRNLFYVDSRTTNLTVAHKLATTLGVPAASRTVFLDNDPSPRAIEFQIKRLIAAAQETGMAIGIGHPHKATLNAIRTYFEGDKQEARIVSVSKIVG
jgi:uncharacterized protein